MTDLDNEIRRALAVIVESTPAGREPVDLTTHTVSPAPPRRSTRRIATAAGWALAAALAVVVLFQLRVPDADQPEVASPATTATPTATGTAASGVEMPPRTGSAVRVAGDVSAGFTTDGAALSGGFTPEFPEPARALDVVFDGPGFDQMVVKAGILPRSLELQTLIVRIGRTTLYADPAACEMLESAVVWVGDALHAVRGMVSCPAQSADGSVTAHVDAAFRYGD